MWEVDAATGAVLNTYTATALGGGETYTGLALDPTSGTVYAAGTNCSRTASFYTIEPTTGEAFLNWANLEWRLFGCHRRRWQWQSLGLRHHW